MAAVSPGMCLEGKQSSDVHFHALQDKSTTAALSTLHTLIQTSFGPCGKVTTIHNNVGGNSIMTSTSSRLIPALTVSKPILRLITSAIQSHLAIYYDGGHFTGLFTLKLVRSYLELDVHKRLISEINEQLLRECLELLGSPQFQCRQDLEVSSLSSLEKVLQCVVSSKVAACGLFVKSDIDHVCKLVVRAFLKTFQGCANGKTGTIHYMRTTGLPATESHILDGVLFAEPHIPAYTTQPFNLQRQTDGCIRIALFTVSMAGDSEQHLNATYEISADESGEDPLGIADAVLNSLEELVGHLVTARVGVVCCQRVVHPYICEMLQAAGILVIHRLGSSHIGPIQALTGATLLANLHEPPSAMAYGVLDQVEHKVLAGRSFLHLQRLAAPVCTLITCQRTESCSEELMHVLKAGEKILRQLLNNPVVLAGGGCWQVHLAARLRDLVEHHGRSWCEQLRCSSFQLSQVARAFCLALDQIAMATAKSHKSNLSHMTDSTHNHNWIASNGINTSDLDDLSKQMPSCCCGLFQSDNKTKFYFLGEDGRSVIEKEKYNDDHANHNVKRMCKAGQFQVVDVFDITVNALKTAVATTNMVLGIENFIDDTN